MIRTLLDSRLKRVLVATILLLAVFGGLPAGALGSESLGSISGRVTKADGITPLPDITATVVLVPSLTQVSAKTDASGDYTIRDLPPGNYHVWFDATAFNLSTDTDYVAEATDRVFTLVGGGAVSGADASLEIGGRISGRVTDARGRPIPGVYVWAERDGAETKFAFTDGDGRYVYPGLPTAEYRVFFIDADNPNGWPAEWYQKYYDNQQWGFADPVAISPGVRRADINAVLGSPPRPKPTKPAVVLVGGIWEDYGFKDPGDPSHPWHDINSYLKARGYDVYVVPSRKDARSPGVVDSRGGYTGDNAYQVQRYLQGQGVKNRDIIIIGHSMGGLIARKWAGSSWMWRSSDLRPKAIIQLGTPNAGSPLPALVRLGKDGLGLQAASQSTYELDQSMPVIGAFNRSYQNASGVPILRLGGEFFPDSAAHQALWPFNLAQALTNTALRSAFGFSTPNDGAVSMASLLAGPTSGNKGSDSYPVMHSDALGLSAFTYGPRPPGFIIPKGDTAVENRILGRIATFCDDVARGRIGATRVLDSSPTLSRSGSSAFSASVGGNAFTTIKNEELTPSPGATSTLSFSVEGTSAVAEIASDDPDLAVAIRNSDGIVASQEQLTPDGRSISFISLPGARYQLDLRSDAPSSAVVSVLDGGPTALLVHTPASVIGSGDATVTARLMRDSANLPGTFVVALDGGAGVAMSDGGLGPDVTASDGIYTALVHMPVSGSAALISVDASSTEGGVAVQRTGFGVTEIVEPRATIGGNPVLATNLTSSGKVGQVFVDVPVSASQDCTIQVAADITADGGLVGQMTAEMALPTGSLLPVRVVFDAEDLRNLPAGATQVLASVKLYDSTDGGLTLLSSRISDSFGLTHTGLALASCTLDPFPAAVSTDPVIVTGNSFCTSETIAGVDISLDGGTEWLAVPAPSGGWGSNETTWSCAFTLPDGEYGASVRLRGENGVIAGATDSLVFSVDMTPPATRISALPSGWATGSVSFSLEASDSAGSGVQNTYYSLDGSDPVTYDGTATVSVEGTTSIAYWSTDGARNRETTKTASVCIDKSAPVFTASVNGDNTAAASVNLAVGDGISGVTSFTYRTDLGAAVLVAGSSTVTPVTTSPGLHTVMYSAIDAAGNQQTGNIDFTVVAPAAIPVTLSTTAKLSGPASVKVRRTLKLTGTVSPSAAPGRVTIAMTRQVGKKWKKYATARVRVTEGKFAYSFRPRYKGKWRFVATYSGGKVGATTYKSSKSGVRTVRVK